MLIDWFTVVAQIVNFLILVVLLKVLLYDRIVKAMEQRQRGIESRFAEAADSKADADRQAEQLRTQRQELQDRREAMLAEARQEAEAHRQELGEQARSDVNEQKRRWLDALEAQRQSFLDELRRQAGSGLCRIARKALDDLADAELERQVGRVFVARLDEMEADGEAARALAAAEGPIVVRSAWPLPADLREELTGKIRGKLGASDAEVEFATDEDVICGVELRRAGRSVGWSAAAYLDELSEALEGHIEAEAEARQHADRGGEQQAEAQAQGEGQEQP